MAERPKLYLLAGNSSMIKIDFHIHSKYSPDSSAEISEILWYAKCRGLDAIAITDHDTLEGNREARRLRKADDVQIIPGIELTLPAGEHGLHVIALNVDEYVPCDGVITTIRWLKEHDATIILPHPYRRYTGLFYHLENGTLTPEEASYVLENIDYLETLNGKDTIRCVQRTLKLAAEARYPIISGTDAHSPEYIGLSYTRIDSLDDFLNGGSSGEIVTFVKSQTVPDLHNLHLFLENGKDDYYGMSENSNYLSFFLRLASRMMGSRFKNIARRLPYIRTIVRFLRLASRMMGSRLEKCRRPLHTERIVRNAPQVTISFNDRCLQVRPTSNE